MLIFQRREGPSSQCSPWMFENVSGSDVDIVSRESRAYDASQFFSYLLICGFDLPRPKQMALGAALQQLMALSEA